MSKADEIMNENESRDYWIMDRIYRENLKGTCYFSKEYPRFFHCDMFCSIVEGDKVIEWNTEIKTANRDGKHYPCFLLKLQKLKDICRVSEGIKLLLAYLDYSDYKCYIYDPYEIDWTQVELIEMKQRVRQCDPSLGYRTYPTFLIPRKLARKTYNFKHIDDAYTAKKQEENNIPQEWKKPDNIQNI